MTTTVWIIVALVILVPILLFRSFGRIFLILIVLAVIAWFVMHGSDAPALR